MRPFRARAPAVLAAVLLLGCATSGAVVQRDGSGRGEALNRGVFWLNLRVDDCLLGPLARGWSLVAPEPARLAVDRLFVNLRFPIRFAANLSQAKARRSASELARFLVNSTLGVGGLFDPARRFGLEPYAEDFGQAFGWWGIGTGPYWVLPLFGPSDPRDAVGLLFDTALDPITWLGFAALPGIGALDLVNSRALAADEIVRARAAALDYYVFVRDAYLQRREALVRDRESLSEEPARRGPADDLYEIEDEEEESLEP
jgi:phospholipid-binding lipoprotein MlaA